MFPKTFMSFKTLFSPILSFQTVQLKLWHKKYALSDMKVKIDFISHLNFYIIYNRDPIQHVVSLKLFQTFHFLYRLSFFIKAFIQKLAIKVLTQKCFDWQKSIIHFKRPKIFLLPLFLLHFYIFFVKDSIA